MGLLSMFTDPTGTMSPSDINKQDISNIIDELNRVQEQLTSSNQTQVIPDNTGTNRILIGVGPDGQIGIFISKAGYDIIQQFTIP